MTMVSPLPQSGSEAPQAAQPVLLSPAKWGYSLTDHGGVQGGDTMLRAFCRFLGGALILSSVGLWALPNAVVLDDTVLLTMKLALTCLFVGLGGLLYLFGRDEGVASTQVDLDDRTVRRGRINSKGAFETDVSIPFEDVTGLLLTSNKTAGRGLRSSLYLRLDDGAGDMTAIEILSGPEQLLRPIRERVLRDLKNDRGGLPLPSFENRRVARMPSRASGVAFCAA